MPQRIDHLGRLVTAAAESTPNTIALKDRTGTSRTYAQLETRTNKLANGLLGLGLEPGSRLASWLSDSVEYLELYLAAAKAGLVLVPINARYMGSEASYLLEDSASSVLVFDDATADKVSGSFSRSDFRQLVTLGEERSLDAQTFEAVVGSGRDAAPPAPDEDALAVIGYTSGTTGFPKGAMLTHRSIKNIARMNTVSYRQPRHSVCAYSGSMSFVATIAGWVATHMYLGGTIIVMGRWEVDELAALVRDEHVTFTYSPSPLINDIAETIENDPSAWESLTCMLHSASKVEPGSIERMARALDGRLIEGLGMTENSGGLVTATTPRDMLGRTEATEIYASVGRTAVDCELRLLSEEGEELPWDGETVGELVFRSPAIMDGYLGQPEATDEAFIDGWYRSGDLGYVDPAGFVYMVERRSDLIISGGMNIYPTEVERVIVELPTVAEVSVVGVPHERWGQTPVAVVATEPGQTISADEIIAHCQASLASYKKPTRVMFVDELPKTASLKIKTGEVREMARSDIA